MHGFGFILIQVKEIEFFMTLLNLFQNNKINKKYEIILKKNFVLEFSA